MPEATGYEFSPPSQSYSEISNNQLRNFSAQLMPASLQFSSDAYSINETGGNATITVTRTGDLSTAVTVNYATSSGPPPPAATTRKPRKPWRSTS